MKHSVSQLEGEERKEELTAQSSAQPSVVPFEQFAAIQAGLLDGFPEAELLDTERIDEDRWRAGRSELLAQIATDPDVFARYQTTLEAHQDRLRCPVSPLYDDVAAWVAFVRRADETPLGALCSELGVTPGDVARLERHWKAQLGSDRALAKEARKLRAEAPSPPLPPLQIGERRYVPWGTASPSPDVSEASAPPAPSLEDAKANLGEDLDRMAALEAYLAEGVDFALLQARYDLASRGQAEGLLAGYRSSLASDRQLSSYFRTRVEHFRRLAAARHTPVAAAALHTFAAEPEVVQAPELAPPASVDATGALDLALLALSPLPFLEGVPVVVPPSATLASLSAPGVGETGIIDLAALEETALPFARVRSAGGADPKEASLDETATLDVELVAWLASLPAVPFSGSAAAPGAGSGEEDGQGPPSTTLGETGLLDVALLAQRDSPFRAPGPSEEVLPAPSPRASSPLSEDVQRYASYCVELAATSHAPAVRTRYGIASLAEHDELSVRWSARLAADPALRARFREASETYRAWLDASRRGGAR